MRARYVTICAQVMVCAIISLQWKTMEGRATRRKRDLVATIWEELTAACKTMDGTKRYAYV